MKGNIFYAQSGGVTPVINATASGLIEHFFKNKKCFGRFYAGKNGILGALNEELIDITSENKMELSDSIDGKFGTFQKNITGVKAQTGTQIRAGLTNEFIDGKEATKAGKEIDLILAHYKKWGRTLSLCKQKLILGRDFKATKDEDIALEKNIKNVIYLFL